MKSLFVLLLIVLASPVYAWDGYDYDKGNFIEIDKGNLVRSGRTIEIFDYNDGNFKDVEVLDIERTPSGVEINVYDPEADEERTFEMDDN